MEEKKESSSNDVPVLDVTDYFSWRSKMKAYLKKFGIWEIVINPPAPSNKKGKPAAQKEAKKDNTTALKFLLDGLPSSLKESVGEFTSAKDLWFKLESEYQKAKPEPEKADQKSEDKPPEELNQEEDKQEEDSSKGMNSCDYDSLCDEIEKVLANDDEAMLKAKQRTINYVCHIDLRADWFLNKVDLNQSDYKAFRTTTFDYMDNLQKQNVELKELLKKLKHEGVGWLKLLKEKEEEKE